MKAFEKAKLGGKYLFNHALQEMDVRTDGHRSKPNIVYAHVTPTCNLKCIHCNLPKVDGIEHGTLRRVNEMSTEEWKKSLTQLAEWLGPFKLNISGGEPFVRKDIMTLLEHACGLGVLTGVVTNGTFITDEIADRLAKMNLFNVNISLDGFRKGTHLHFRARHFEKTMEAFDRLDAARKRHGVDMRILIKFTLMGYNCKEAIEVLEWAQEKGFDGVMMQPLELKHDDIDLDYLWPSDFREMDAVVDRLLEMKAEGYPLLNDTSHLRKFKDYFRAAKHRQASLLERQGICHVGVTNFFIGSNGDVVTCFYMDPVGNLRAEAPRQIWEGAQARKRREEIRTCGRDCLLTCMTTRTLRDKAELFLKVL
jgi:MoaA/NifB/PqqE/SkfB family radical SAM enzyme